MQMDEVPVPAGGDVLVVRLKICFTFSWNVMITGQYYILKIKLFLSKKKRIHSADIHLIGILLLLIRANC